MGARGAVPGGPRSRNYKSNYKQAITFSLSRLQPGPLRALISCIRVVLTELFFVSLFTL